MLDEVIKLYPNLIDTSRVGIHGMSQGAAVTNWLSLKKFINDGWGANGRFAWPDAGASFFGWVTLVLYEGSHFVANGFGFFRNCKVDHDLPRDFV